jgi:hypothetical protein
MDHATPSDELGLGDETFIALFSPVLRGGLRLNDGVDEALAGADLLEMTLGGQAPSSRRDAKRWIDTYQRDRCRHEVDRLTALGILGPVPDPEFIVKLPGARDRGLARVGDLTFTDPQPGEALRAGIVRALRDPGEGDARTLSLAMLTDTGPWMKSRVAPDPDAGDVRDRVKRMRKGKDVPPVLTAWLDALGVDLAAVVTVLDATRLAVRNSIAAW